MMHSESDESDSGYDITYEDWVEDYETSFQFRCWDDVERLQDEYPLYLRWYREE